MNEPVTPLTTRVDHIVRTFLDTHLDLMGVLLAEHGVALDEQIRRLDEVVLALRNRKLEDTIFEGGRRMPVLLSEDHSHIRLNKELLSRVNDEDILQALSRPVAQILEISALSIALTFQVHDEKQFRNLLTRATRAAQETPAKAQQIPSFVRWRLDLFESRVAIVCQLLEIPNEWEKPGRETLPRLLDISKTWPEWSDLEGEYPQSLEASLASGLGDNNEATLIAELIWESLSLSGQSFLRHAGRAIRGHHSDGSRSYLQIFARMVLTEDPTFSDNLFDWPAFHDVAQSVVRLENSERAFFGTPSVDTMEPISVVQPASEVFGLTEPVELPWGFPLIAWTVREQTAIRDLLEGIAKTLPSVHVDDSVHAADPEPVRVEDSTAQLGIQVIAGAEPAEVVPSPLMYRGFWSAFDLMKKGYMNMDEEGKADVVAKMRSFYDLSFPDAHQIWQRRLHASDDLSMASLVRLSLLPQLLFDKPVFLDPFAAPDSETLLPYPVLTFVVTIQNVETRTPFCLPLSALTATMNGIPIRIRVLEPASRQGFRWHCDRTLSIGKLQGQPVDLLLRSAQGDALQMAVFPS